MSSGAEAFLGATPDWRPAALEEGLAPPDDGVDLWRIDLDGADENAAIKLTEDEQSRAQRFVFERDRLRFTAGRRAFRHILGAYRPDLGDGALKFAKNGAPLFGEGALAVSFSRSGRLAMAAVAKTGRLGVDIERLDDHADLRLTAAAHFSPSEFDAFDQADGAARAHHFYRAWTGKEALLKATGEGLSEALRSLSIDLRTAETAAETYPGGAIAMSLLEGPEGYEPDQWRLAWCPIDAQNVLSVARDATIGRLRFLQYN